MLATVVKKPDANSLLYFVRYTYPVLDTVRECTMHETLGDCDVWRKF
jgi:hypothetical protein